MLNSALNQEVLLARVNATTRNPQAQFDTLQALMLQDDAVARFTECTEGNSALQLTRLGATLLDTIW